MKKVKAQLYKTDGTIIDIVPDNRKTFSLKELQRYVDGIIEIQNLLEDKKIVVLNEEGKLIGLKINEKATEIWKKNYPIEKYPNNNDELIVGDVIICDEKLIK